MAGQRREGRCRAGRPVIHIFPCFTTQERHARRIWLSKPTLPIRPRWVKPKPARIFQPVAERAVDADMGEPDHRDGQHRKRLQSANPAVIIAIGPHVGVRGIID